MVVWVSPQIRSLEETTALPQTHSWWFIAFWTRPCPSKTTGAHPDGPGAHPHGIIYSSGVGTGGTCGWKNFWRVGWGEVSNVI